MLHENFLNPFLFKSEEMFVRNPVKGSPIIRVIFKRVGDRLFKAFMISEKAFSESSKFDERWRVWILVRGKSVWKKFLTGSSSYSVLIESFKCRRFLSWLISLHNIEKFLTRLWDEFLRNEAREAKDFFPIMPKAVREKDVIFESFREFKVRKVDFKYNFLERF